MNFSGELFETVLRNTGVELISRECSSTGYWYVSVKMKEDSQKIVNDLRNAGFIVDTNEFYMHESAWIIKGRTK
jgi:hypothetical protein